MGNRMSVQQGSTRTRRRQIPTENGLSATDCPLCAATGRSRFAANGIPICDCPGCGHRFAAIVAAPDHVNTVYGDDYFTAGGAGYRDYFQEAGLLRASGRYYARRIAPFVPTGKLLDVGAAAGFVLQGFVDGGWSASGVEPNPRMAGYARDTLGLDVATGTLENYAESRLFDLVTMIQITSHLTDLHRSFDLVANLTRPGGCCLIETWDCHSLTARLLGKHWHEYSPPSVLHWFSRQRLVRLLNQHGFSLVAQGRRIKWISGDHARSLAGFKLSDSPLGRRISGLLEWLPTGRAIPYPSEDLFWALFRKRASQ
jgi:SAM-dependent methyltransferase